LACGIVKIGNYLCDAAKLEMFAEYSGNLAMKPSENWEKIDIQFYQTFGKYFCVGRFLFIIFE
jgi:hypothetical protein